MHHPHPATSPSTHHKQAAEPTHTCSRRRAGRSQHTPKAGGRANTRQEQAAGQHREHTAAQTAKRHKIKTKQASPLGSELPQETDSPQGKTETRAYMSTTRISHIHCPLRRPEASQRRHFFRSTSNRLNAARFRSNRKPSPCCHKDLYKCAPKQNNRAKRG